MPHVNRYMTREPYSVASTDSLAHARQMMLAHSIRHLPVIDNDRLVGVLADRDVVTAETIPTVDLERVVVAQMMAAPIEVWGEMPLDEVAELMTKHRTDCVIVRGGHGVQGIFTASDALVALTDLLRRATA